MFMLRKDIGATDLMDISLFKISTQVMKRTLKYRRSHFQFFI